jgi:ABC-type uncharacterized transport system permease subunit
MTTYEYHTDLVTTLNKAECIKEKEKALDTWEASTLSQWKWQNFPRAETTLLYAITLSKSEAFGCLITLYNLDSDSVEID